MALYGGGDVFRLNEVQGVGNDIGDETGGEIARFVFLVVLKTDELAP